MLESDGGRLKDIPEHTDVFEINGPMFFAASDKISVPVRDGVKIIIIRMRNVPALDETAMRALRSVYNICKSKDVRVFISHANEQPYSVMKKDGFVAEIGEDSFFPHIDAALEAARNAQI